MLRLTACIEMMFKEYDYNKRPAAAADIGLDGVEFWGWASKDLAAIGDAAKAAGMPITSCSIDTKDEACQEAWRKFGMLDLSNVQVFVDMVGESIMAMKPLDIPTLIVCTGNTLPGRTRQLQEEAVLACLTAAAPIAQQHGIQLVLEPLNPVIDHIGHYLNTSAQAFHILKIVNHPSVKLLFDIYHQQVTEGNVINNIVQNIDLIGHFHVADSPGRHQPGTGEMNYHNIFHAIEDAGFKQWVGLEYSPTIETEKSLLEVMKYAHHS